MKTLYTYFFLFFLIACSDNLKTSESKKKLSLNIHFKDSTRQGYRYYPFYEYKGVLIFSSFHQKHLKIRVDDTVFYDRVVYLPNDKKEVFEIKKQRNYQKIFISVDHSEEVSLPFDYDYDRLFLSCDTVDNHLQIDAAIRNTPLIMF